MHTQHRVKETGVPEEITENQSCKQMSHPERCLSQDKNLQHPILTGDRHFNHCANNHPWSMCWACIYAHLYAFVMCTHFLKWEKSKAINTRIMSNNLSFFFFFFVNIYKNLEGFWLVLICTWHHFEVSTVNLFRY